MPYRALTFGVVALALVLRAQVAHGGATTIPEFRIGSCGSGPAATACGWDCTKEINAFPATCPAPNSCSLDVTESFTAHVIVRGDDGPCGAAGGMVLEIGLFGTKADQSTFTVPSRTINLCGVNNACGACDTDVCSATDTSCPLDAIFYCELTGANQVGPEQCPRPSNEQGERRFCERDLADLPGWLAAGKQPLLAEMAVDLAAEFPAATGPAVVKSAFEIARDDQSGDPGRATIGSYCLEVGFLRTPKPVTRIPAEVALAPRSTSSLVVSGDCDCGNGFQDAGEECDDGNIVNGDGCSAACTLETANCPAAPDPGCASAFNACILQANEKKVGKESLLAKWSKGPAIAGASLGNPLGPGGTAYDLCVYDGAGALKRGYRVARAGQDCGSKPCWKKVGKPPGDPGHKGYNYKDKAATADGMFAIQLKGGDQGKSMFLAKGKNDVDKGLTALPTGLAAALAGSSGATIQLRGSDAATCVSCPLSTVDKDDGVIFKATK